MVMGDMEMKVDLLVIGSGPGGCAAAFRGADLGLDVALIDPSADPGGFRFYDSCIAENISMFLAECINNHEKIQDIGIHFNKPVIDLEKIRTWKEKYIADMTANLAALAEKRGVQMIHAPVSFENSTTVRLDGGEISRIRFKHAVIALVAGPADLPAGTPADSSRILRREAAMDLPEIPASLLVVGAEHGGLELGCFYAAIGSRVQLVEKESCLLSAVDQDLVAILQQVLEARFERIDLETRVHSCKEHSSKVTAELNRKGKIETYQYDRVLFTGPGKVSTEKFGLNNLALKLDQTGAVRTDSQQRTGENTVFAVGDICGGAALAHTAILQGKIAAETAAGLRAVFDVRAIPRIIHTYPQLAWCGLTEKEAASQDLEVRIVRVPWKGSTAARSISGTVGMTKILLDPDTGRILGMAACGHGAAGLIPECVLAIEMGAVAEDLAFILHPHPSLSETLGEAAEIFLGTSIHTLPG